MYKRARIYGDDLMFIDKNLICELVDHIVTSGKNRILSSSGQTGSILVFLPGYDEILNTRHDPKQRKKALQGRACLIESLNLPP